MRDQTRLTIWLPGGEDRELTTIYTPAQAIHAMESGDPLPSVNTGGREYHINYRWLIEHAIGWTVEEIKR